MDDSALPENFLRADIKVGNRRHLVFYNDQLLDLLKAAKEWYVDGTFKSVGAPFVQLWSIHVFISHGDSVKQVPVLYSLMSGKSTEDYKVILEHISTSNALEIQSVVMDFENASWNAFRDIFPEANRKGCHFHWTQALWRKVQALGLVVAYNTNAQVQKFIRRLMCLPFLPHEHIRPTFASILALDTAQNHMSPVLRQFLDYIQTQWIFSSVWPPAAWSMFDRSIRTNNDCEGWHRRLNSKIRRHNLPMYQLVEVIHKEAQFVDIQAQFLADDKLTRHIRKKPRTDQARILSAWQKFKSNDCTSKDLLRVNNN